MTRTTFIVIWALGTGHWALATGHGALGTGHFRMPHPTSKDVVKYLNARFEARGLPYRLEHIAVLPYQNPMWLANWDVPQLADAPERDVIEEELREARWRFPQVLDEW